MLIDLDHLVEFYKFSEKKFSAKNFVEFFDLLYYKKAYVVFHSYELLLPLGIIISFYSKSFFLSGLAIGFAIHMFLDLIGNPVYLRGYFLFYRIFTGFKKEKFIDVEKHFKNSEKRKIAKLKNSKVLGFIILVSLFSLLSSSCTVLRGKPEVSRLFYKEKGLASWYGEDFHGRPTSSGEIYDMYGLTAAHRTLPLQTMVHVTNLENGKSVNVKINDRGPFVGGRVIDLSYGAARILNMVEAGISMVTLEVVDTNIDFEDKLKIGVFTVQVGAFLVRENAERLMRNLNKKYGDAYITIYETNSKKFNRVRVGSFLTLEEAQKFAKKLEEKKFNTFVARKD